MVIVDRLCPLAIHSNTKGYPPAACALSQHAKRGMPGGADQRRTGGDEDDAEVVVDVQPALEQHDRQRARKHDQRAAQHLEHRRVPAARRVYRVCRVCRVCRVRMHGPPNGAWHASKHVWPWGISGT